MLAVNGIGIAPLRPDKTVRPRDRERVLPSTALSSSRLQATASTARLKLLRAGSGRALVRIPRSSSCRASQIANSLIELDSSGVLARYCGSNHIVWRSWLILRCHAPHVACVQSDRLKCSTSHDRFPDLVSRERVALRNIVGPISMQREEGRDDDRSA